MSACADFMRVKNSITQLCSIMLALYSCCNYASEFNNSDWLFMQVY
jgi:hypothetical protein